MSHKHLQTYLRHYLGLYPTDRSQFTFRGLPQDGSFPVGGKALKLENRTLPLHSPHTRSAQELLDTEMANWTDLSELERFDWDQYRNVTFRDINPHLRDKQAEAVIDDLHLNGYEVPDGEEVVRIVYWFT